MLFVDHISTAIATAITIVSSVLLTFLLRFIDFKKGEDHTTLEMDGAARRQQERGERGFGKVSRKTCWNFRAEFVKASVNRMLSGVIFLAQS